jgi:hypothetical protein
MGCLGNHDLPVNGSTTTVEAVMVLLSTKIKERPRTISAMTAMLMLAGIAKICDYVTAA